MKKSETEKSATLKVCTLKRLKKSNKADKQRVKLNWPKEKDKTQMTKIKSEREEISTDVTEIKM